MSEDASLDEFLDAGGDGDESDDDRTPDDEAGDRDPDGAEPEVDDAERGPDAAEDDADADGTTDEGAGAASDDGDAGDANAAANPLDDVDPAAATATWSPDGAACAACGTVVERRWRDGEDLVCGDCKEW